MNLDFNTFLNFVNGCEKITQFEIEKDAEFYHLTIFLGDFKNIDGCCFEDVGNYYYEGVDNFSEENLKKLELIEEIITGFNVNFSFKNEVNDKNFVSIQLKFNLDMLKDFELVKKD
jgi:hypothetical protein